MNPTLSRLGVFRYALVFLAAFSVPAELALAQDGEAAFPENATAKTYGSGWECDRGNCKLSAMIGCARHEFPIPNKLVLQQKIGAAIYRLIGRED